MPTVTLNKKRVLELLGKKYDDKSLADRIAMLGTDLEAITDTEITVEVFPNRPDMLSEEGLARGLRSFLGIETGLKKYKISKSGATVVVDESVKNARPYTAVGIVKGLALNDERIKQIIQLQEKLHVTFGRHRKKAAIGIYPLDKIALPIRYVAKKPEEIRFAPLGFSKEMSAMEILENHPTGKEYRHLMDGLKKYPLFVDSKNHVLSMPPIINSETIGKVTESTKDVFVECTGFDFGTLRICLNIVMSALADMGGELYSMNLAYPDKKYVSPDMEPQKMKLDINYVNKLLGLSLKQAELKQLLAKMGIGFEAGSALIPAYRADILHPIDLVEDIAIAYGYENFDAQIPKVATIGGESRGATLKRKIAEVLSGLGFLECNTYHLSNEKDLIEKMNAKKTSLVKLSNSVNIDYDAMRNAILPILMKVLSENKHNEYPQKIFESGIVFAEDSKEETGVSERASLSAVSAHPTADFSEMKAVLDALMRAFDIKYEVKEKENPSYIPGRCAEIIVAGKSVGMIGELHPQVLNNWEIEMPVAAFEVDVERVFG